MFYEDERYGHIRDYNFKEIEKLLNMFNFQIVKSCTDGVYYKEKLMVSSKFIPKTFGDTVIIKARKK